MVLQLRLQLPPSMLEGSHISPYPHNLQRAKELIRASGINNLTLELYTRDDGSGGLFKRTEKLVVEDLKAAEEFNIKPSHYTFRGVHKDQRIPEIGHIHIKMDGDREEIRTTS